MRYLALLLLAAGRQDKPVVAIVTLEKTFNADAAAIASSESAMTVTATVGGEARKIDCKDIVEMRFGPAGELPAAVDPSIVLVELINGDRVAGRILAESGATLPIESPALGKVEVPMDHVARVWILANPSAAVKAPGKKETDAALFTSGDRDGGTVIRIGPVEVTMKSNRFDKKLAYKLADLTLIHFRELKPPPAETGAPLAVMEFSDTSVRRGRGLDLDAVRLKWKDLWGKDVEAPAASLRHVSFKNGNVVYLSDLAPTAVDENANYIRTNEPVEGDLRIPWAADRNARGGPLSIRGRAHRKGLGVHAYSALTFDLGASYSRFSATAAIDDCAGEFGNVLFEVYADDKKIYASPAVKASDAGAEVDLDVKGVRNLRLVVDFGEDMGVGDYADWASARLIR